MLKVVAACGRKNLSSLFTTTLAIFSKEVMAAKNQNERPCVASLKDVALATPGPLAATFFQLLPPSRDTCTLPSSVPTHSTFGVKGDSLNVVTVGYSCTPSCRESVFLSGVLPKICSLLRSTPVVRSPPRRVHVSPRSVDLNK